MTMSILQDDNNNEMNENIQHTIKTFILQINVPPNLSAMVMKGHYEFTFTIIRLY